MRRYLAIGLLAAAVAAGCGSDDEEQATGAAAGGGSETVAVKEVSGIGRVLVDAGGAALYSADQEADGTVKCVDECLAFWQPVAAPQSGEPTAGEGVPGELDVIEREDGTRQVTYDGKPVYRFSEDPPGEVTGDGFEDDFGGTTFSWRAVKLGGGDAEEAPEPRRGGGGYDYGG